MPAPLNESTHSIGIWTRLYRYAKHIHAVCDARRSLGEANDGAAAAAELEPLLVMVIRLARKQQNLGLASRLIDDQIGAQSMGREYERAKLQYALGQFNDAVTGLTNIVLRSRDDPDAGQLFLQHRKGPLRGRVLLRIANWLQDERVTTALSPELLPAFSAAEIWSDISALPDGPARLEQANESCKQENPLPSLLTEGCLRLAMQWGPDFAKSHLHYAGWCHRQGRRIIARSFDFSRVAGAEGLSAGDTGTLFVVRSVIQAWAAGQQEPPDMNAKLRSVVELFADTHMSEDIVKMDDDSDKGDTTSRLLAVQSALEQLLPNLEAADLQKLLDAWQSIHTLLLASYRHAVEAYFSFLRIGGGVARATQPDVSEAKKLVTDTPDADSLCVSEEDTITASLRLLRLLVRHGLELKELFAANFGGTPTAAWQRIIPQLFARLAHPSEYVQSEVLKLLCRIGEDSPNLIVYPSVVGLNSASGASAVDGDTPREETTVNAHQNLSKIVQSISAHSPVLVDQIKEMIMELKRITVLWEEQWIDGLMQRTADVNRRLQRLKEEADRVSENKTLRLSEKRRLLREKHAAILKPVLVSLESLQRRTLAQGATSPHEVSFLRLYGPRIEAALEMLRNPKVQEDYDPLKVWQPFEDVLLNLRENSKRRLDLKHISPKLAGRQASAIPMPGLLAGTKAQVVTIQSFQSEVLILPTKTKPKKLALIGSDGRRYSYLFKGLEDLHLDERMMQFLDVVNATFSRTGAGIGQQDAFRARNYNVIPLGEQSGLIQWVDGTLPLFSLFKKWQHRKLVQSEEHETNAASQTGKVLAAQEGMTEKSKTTRPVAVPRPSELFYKKLTPALKSRGVKTTALRSKWPKDVLRKVFHDLVRETPGDLILRELHLTSSSPADYLDTMNTFSRSMATMSMIGYIFGLGDRHLDNILLDVTSGEVVHIDFGVCFEKGKRLRVPEVVPFRLTQNFVKALGITGIEGSFRASCEHVLRLLRKSRETLLTLLEAFVYDPLVDWEPDHKSDLEKKAMERNISHTLLASRIVELKVPLRLNQEKLTKFLPPFQDLLDINTTTFRTYMSVQQQLQRYDMELAAVSAAPTDMEAVFESLAALYAEELNENSNVNMIASSIFKSCIGIDQWHEQHVTALEAIRGRHLTVVKSDMANAGRFDLLNAGSLRDASEFLRSSGQRQLLAQYEEQLVHVRDSVRAYRSGLSRCLDALLSYQTIAAAFPRDFVNRNRCYLWCEWRQKLLYEPSTQLCVDILGSFLYAPVARSAAVSCVQMELELVKIIGVKKSDMAGFPFRAAPEARKAELQSEAQLAKADIVRYAVRGQPSVLDCAFVAALSEKSATLEVEEQQSLVERQGPMTFNSTMSRFEYMCTEVQVLGDIIGLAHDDSAAPQQVGDIAPTTTQLQSEDAASTVACFSALQQVFFRLQRLLSNFDNVVLPQTITTMQLDYPSVQECVQRLDDVCDNLNAVMDSLQSTDAVDAYARFSVLYGPLKARFDELVRESQPAGSDELLPWQRLFASFNAPFAELESSLEIFQSKVQHGTFPHAWANVVPRHPCKDAPAQSAQSVEILSAIFLVKRLEILKSCLFSCRMYTVAFNRRYAEETVEGDQSEFISTLDCGAPLVRSFINHFYSHRLVGCMSSMFQTVASTMFSALGVDAKRVQADSWATSDGPVTYRELQRIATSRFRESYKTEQHLLQMVSKLDHFTSLQVKLFHVFRAEGIRSVAEAALSFAQLQLTRFQWLHHEVLSKHSETQPVRPPLDTIMTEMYTSTRDLAAAQASLARTSEQMYQLESSIAQRLMWAKNSNRALEPVFAAFSAGKESRQNASAEEVKISGILTGISNAIVHMETYRRQNQETMRFGHTFGILVKSYGKVLSNRDRLRASADQLERSLPPNLKELAPGGQVTRAWIEERVANLPGLIEEAKSTLNRVTSSLPSQRQALGLQINEGREAVAETRTLMTELEPLLSPVVAAGDPSAKDLVSSWHAWLRDIELYFEATSGFASDLGPVGDSESTKDTVVGILNGQNFTHDHAQGLKTVNEKIKRLSNLSSFAGDDLEQPDEPNAEPVVEDVQVGQVTRMKQEKNSHAVGIWKRVRAKLEGRDGENAEKLSVSQQVDAVLQVATSHEHLSQMFEGWTSWI
jgi:PI-3-kinase-related kinase SMG-1